MSSKFKYILLFTISIITYCIIYYWANDITIQELDTHIPGPNVLIVGGTHGNEPAGTFAIENLNFELKRGKIIMVPRANKLGLLLNTRYLPHKLLNRDLNRNYPREEGEFPLDFISSKICNLAKKADFIIDLHEGWGYNLLTPESLGSGVYPGNTKEAIVLAHNTVDKLNESISIPYKKFVVGLNNHPELKSLRNYCVLNNKNYILVETTGQNDIQPLHIRVQQHQFIIYSVLRNLKMI